MKIGKTQKHIFSFLLSFANACVFGYVLSKGDTSYAYIGTQYYGCNPACLAFFALDYILLFRFFSKEYYLNRRAMFVSIVIGYLLALSALWGTYIMYGTNSVFDNASKVVGSIFLAALLSLFTVPLFSELICFFESVQVKVDKKSINPFVYFSIIWILIFISFFPLFLYYWPGNFSYDVGDQIRDFYNHSHSTHHPLLHTLLVSWAYDLGYRMGNINKGFQLYTLLQMSVYAASFATFMTYIRKKVGMLTRIVILLLFMLNPVNGFFAISTVKGVMCTAFLIFALVLLMTIVEAEGKGKVWQYCLLVACLIMSALFRNNMIYAIVLGGIIIVALSKGWKHKTIFLLIFLLTFIGFKASNKILVTTTNAVVCDTHRESLSLPLSCMARTINYHRDELNEETINQVYSFMSEDAVANYSLLIADGVKMYADENALRNNKLGFWKLFVKIGLQYPGEYINTFLGLTIGYWFPMEFPYCINGNTKLGWGYIMDGYESPSNTNLLPIGGAIFDYLYGDSDGRLQLPIIGWLFRGAIYFWGWLFALGYVIYKKNKKKLSILIIPFLYLCTCLLGPVSWLRYIIVNIGAFPIMLYVLLEKETK